MKQEHNYSDFVIGGCFGKLYWDGFDKITNFSFFAFKSFQLHFYSLFYYIIFYLCVLEH